MWWWQTLGYTPAGIECWNAMRALDYLETRKEVDPKRIGVTGRSGGGATAWWVAAADDRPQCIIPVAGIADLQAHVCEGVAPRYKRRRHHRPLRLHVLRQHLSLGLPEVMALCAPRPLLLGNSDADDIFPVAGYRRLADKVRRIYDLYGAGDRFALLETQGPHKDTPELRLGALPLDEPLAQERRRRSDGAGAADFDAASSSRCSTACRPMRSTPRIHETFLKPAVIELPQAPAVAREWWAGKAPELLEALREQVFRGWPSIAAALERAAGRGRRSTTACGCGPTTSSARRRSSCGCGC